ncbi:MAG: hypothetical protein KF749_05750 [Bacteroidetes bacterium]|nr:hypothetical protein [Bacteroidota bacterium]MCW5894712.1 hypothetical protein [Bacteroidota bacterium]
MSTSNRFFYLFVLSILAFASCTKETLEPQSERTTLGHILLTVVTSLPNPNDFQFRGRVEGFGGSGDTLLTVPGVGTFNHYTALRDTLTGDTAWVYYTLPPGERLKVDTTSRTVLIYKKTDAGFALILKSKNDSLIAMVNTLPPAELDTLFTKAGEQRFRVVVGTELYTSRNTPCGREGDYNMMFSSAEGSANIPPGRSGLLQTGDKIYNVSNVLNTQIIKDLGSCSNFRSAFQFMILQQ